MRRVVYYLLLKVDIKFVSARLILFSAGASFWDGEGGLIGVIYEYNVPSEYIKKEYT